MLEKHTKILKRHTNIFEGHIKILERHTNIFEENTRTQYGWGALVFFYSYFEKAI